MQEGLRELRVYYPAFALIRSNRKIFDAALEEMFGARPKLRYTADGRRPGYFREIRWLVPKIMGLINLLISAAETPPRRSEARKYVEEVIKDSKAFRRKALRVGEILSMSAGEVFPDRSQDEEIWKFLDASHLEGAHPDPAINRSALIRHHLAIESALRCYLTYVPADSGGRINILTGRVGNRKARFVAECGRIFSEIRPEDLTAKANEPFYGFCGLMYELLTREKVEINLLTGEKKRVEFVGLKRYVDYAVPLLKWQNRGLALIDRVNMMGIGDDYETVWGPKIRGLWQRTKAIDQKLEAGPPGRKKAA